MLRGKLLLVLLSLALLGATVWLVQAQAAEAAGPEPAAPVAASEPPAGRGPALAQAEGALPPPPQRQTAAARVQPALAFDAGSVSGTVVDQGQQPLRGIEVTLHPGDPRGLLPRADVLATTVTDEAGRFRFAGCERFTPLLVRARAPGLVPGARMAQAGRLLEITLRPGCVLHGRLTLDPDRRPASDFLITLDPERGEVPQRCDVATGADGSFELPPAPPDSSLQLWLRGPDGWIEERRIVVGQDARQRLDLAVQPGEVLSLDVLDAETSRPVVDAVVRDPWSREVARSDAKGRATVRVSVQGASSQRTSLELDAPGYAPARWSMRNSLRHPDAPTRMLLVRAVEVTGLVTAADGAPVRDALVQLEHLDQASDTTEEQTRAFAALADGTRRRLAHLIGDVRTQDDPPVRTDADGRFHMARVAHRSGLVRARVRVVAAGFCETVSAWGDAFLPGGRLELPVRLRGGATIRGVVRGDGRPVRARVRLEGENEIPPRTVASDDQGSYELRDVIPGRRTLQTSLEALPFITSSAVVDVTAGQTVSLDFGLRLDTLSISGVLRAQDGQPIANHTVLAQRGGSGGGPAATHSTRSGADGTFRFALPADAQGPFTLSASRAPALTRREQVMPGDSDVVLVMPDTCRLVVEAVDADGATAPPFRLWWKSAMHDTWVPQRGGEADNRLKPEADGTVVVLVPAGALQLRLEDPWDGYLPELVQRTVAAGPDATRLRVVLHKGVEITVALGGARDGFPSPVFLIHPEDQDRMRWPDHLPYQAGEAIAREFPWAPGVTCWPIGLRAPGEVRVRPLTPGVYRLWHANPKVTFTPPTLTVGAGAGQRFEVGWSQG